MTASLTIGPHLYHWPADKKRDFYFRIADEAPVETVYLGEVICSKREPFFKDHIEEVAQRLKTADKKVVLCSLAEVMLPRERKMTEELCKITDYEIEANDSSALYHLRGKPHRIGQYFNTYNEDSMEFMASKGATHFSLNAEFPKEVLAILGQKAKELNVGIEVQVYGRAGLALSARCYHARSYDRIKNNCQFVCEEDPDGMELKTVDNQNFLAVNGIQTLTHPCVNLIQELSEMIEMGITHFRLSPHNLDMVEVANIYKSVIDQKTSPQEAVTKLGELGFKDNFTNGFYHNDRGYIWKAA